LFGGIENPPNADYLPPYAYLSEGQYGEENSMGLETTGGINREVPY